MDQDELRLTLADLRAQRDALSPESPAREPLEKLITRLEQHLEDPESDREGLLEGLKHSVQQFEAEHPKLTLTLNQIMMKLSAMGI